MSFLGTCVLGAALVALTIIALIVVYVDEFRDYVDHVEDEDGDDVL